MYMLLNESIASLPLFLQGCFGRHFHVLANFSLLCPVSASRYIILLLFQFIFYLQFSLLGNITNLPGTNTHSGGTAIN